MISLIKHALYNLYMDRTERKQTRNKKIVTELVSIRSLLVSNLTDPKMRVILSLIEEAIESADLIAYAETEQKENNV